LKGGLQLLEQGEQSLRIHARGLHVHGLVSGENIATDRCMISKVDASGRLGPTRLSWCICHSDSI
jgi:hypothetical protein